MRDWQAMNITGDPNQGYTCQHLEPLRHKSGSNEMFIDGHAATLHERVMTDLKTWDDRIYIDSGR